MTVVAVLNFGVGWNFFERVDKPSASAGCLERMCFARFEVDPPLCDVRVSQVSHFAWKELGIGMKCIQTLLRFLRIELSDILGPNIDKNYFINSPTSILTNQRRVEFLHQNQCTKWSTLCYIIDDSASSRLIREGEHQEYEWEEDAKNTVPHHLSVSNSN